MAQDGTKSNEPAPVDPKVDFLAGTVAGAAGLLVGQPFDTIKVRFQSPQFTGRYRSTWGAFGAIVKEESFKGLFKGVTSPMAGIAFINGVIFTSYGFFMKLPIPGLDGRGIGGTTNDEPSLWRIGLAGAGSGLVASLLSAPTELIKIRQQSAPTHLSPSTLDVFRGIVKREGVRGLYRGWVPTGGRELAYGPYFITYEGLCRYFRSRRKSDPSYHPSSPRLAHLVDPHSHGSRHADTVYTTDVATAHRSAGTAAVAMGQGNAHTHTHTHTSLAEEAENELGELSWGELMLAGGVAGMVSWSATFPLDVLKTRIQSVQPDSYGRIPTRQTLLGAAREAVRTEGYRVFWAGITPTLLRAFPANCVVFLTFEAIVAACR